MANDKVFIVEVEDEVVQVTHYVVRATDKEHAEKLVSQGFYILESAADNVDVISSTVKNVEEIEETENTK